MHPDHNHSRACRPTCITVTTICRKDIRIGEIQKGCPFLWNGEIWIRTTIVSEKAVESPSSTTVWALNLSTGIIQELSIDIFVQPVKLDCTATII